MAPICSRHWSICNKREPRNWTASFHFGTWAMYFCCTEACPLPPINGLHLPCRLTSVCLQGTSIVLFRGFFLSCDILFLKTAFLFSRYPLQECQGLSGVNEPHIYADGAACINSSHMCKHCKNERVLSKISIYKVVLKNKHQLSSQRLHLKQRAYSKNAMPCTV